VQGAAFFAFVNDRTVRRSISDTEFPSLLKMVAPTSEVTVFRVDAVPANGSAAAKLYLIETPASADQVRQLALPLLADGVRDVATLHETPPVADDDVVEVWPKPGVMDPAAASVEEALRRRGLEVVSVQTGRRLKRADLVANGIIEEVHETPHLPTSLPHPPTMPFELRHVELTTLDDDGLQRLSRQGHLFLNLAEMQAIRDHYQTLGREPTDVELETLAQTWSEHCVHKTLKSAVSVRDESGNELRGYGNLIKETIFASTQTIMKRRNDGLCLSVFVDNAGVIAFDDEDGVCFKVETHNRPSAIEPYGGAATGIGGVIRDVLGTGLGARPIACTDVFCVAPESVEVPKGVLPPTRVLDGIVGGVRDYGNRMGIPTVNGAIVYHDHYVANPLVFCGCVGVLPRNKIDKAARPGDCIVVMGGRTGRDGIHGATFSSAELTETAGSEFGHAVQIGNAITEKKVADVLLIARDRGLFSAVTDCGAGGLSSAVGEMGEDVGADVQLDKVPLKYAGLRYDEVWISEAQERMVFAVPAEQLDALLALSAEHDVETTAIGTFGYGSNEPMLRLSWNGTEVAELSMGLLHDGVPMPTREAVVMQAGPAVGRASARREPDVVLKHDLLEKLADPNVASKHRVVRQYDHEVQGNTIVKPFVGPMQIGPSDAAVMRVKHGSSRGVVMSCGLAPHIEEPYQMSLQAIDEAVRNAICVGVDPERMALLDNFCWPGTDNPEAMGTLVRACEACRDAALAWNTPFVSGKDSLHNQFTDRETGRTIKIPPTLLISVFGIIDDVTRATTSDLKRAGDTLWLVSATGDDLESRWRSHLAVSRLIRGGTVTAAHDVSDGGWLVAAAEMAIGGHLGLDLIDLDEAFEEPMTSYLVAGEGLSFDASLVTRQVGTVVQRAELRAGDDAVLVEALRRSWRGEA
jgi:phosphoribosylformylglycinamidine synthase